MLKLETHGPSATKWIITEWEKGRSGWPVSLARVGQDGATATPSYNSRSPVLKLEPMWNSTSAECWCLCYVYLGLNVGSHYYRVLMTENGHWIGISSVLTGAKQNIVHVWLFSISPLWLPATSTNFCFCAIPPRLVKSIFQIAKAQLCHRWPNQQIFPLSDHDGARASVTSSKSIHTTLQHHSSRLV